MAFIYFCKNLGASILYLIGSGVFFWFSYESFDGSMGGGGRRAAMQFSQHPIAFLFRLGFSVLIALVLLGAAYNRFRKLWESDPD